MFKINKLFVTGVFSILLGFSTYGQEVNRGPDPLFTKLQSAGILPPNSIPSFNETIVAEYNPLPGFPVGSPIGIAVPPFEIIPDFPPTLIGVGPGIDPGGDVIALDPGLEFTATILAGNESLPVDSLKPAVPPPVPVVVPDGSSTLFLATLGVIGLCLFGVANKQRNIRAEKV